jgi:hypothetical protein
MYVPNQQVHRLCRERARRAERERERERKWGRLIVVKIDDFTADVGTWSKQGIGRATRER